MTESTHPMQENQDIPLGQKLKQAREALHLSIEDVAKKTNLKKSHIESLENDIFILQNVAPTFVRGYVRNYLRFLRLPEALVSTVNYGEVIIPKDAIKTPSPKVVQKSQTKWVKYLTILVLLGPVGMTLLWWWQDYQKEQESREHIVSSSVVEPTATQATAPITAPVVETPSAPVAVAPVMETPKAETTSPMPTENSALNTAAATEQPQVSVTPEATTEAVNVLQQPAIEPAAEQSQAAAVGNDELRIEITGKESWITVKGSKSKKSLAEKLYSNGEVLTFNGDEQYRLTIGAPANVKLYYKGQEVPLKIDGRVARIRLPLAQ
ncbi:RodZ domain-containing protein [Actinobacillus pleuropneumoniae]|uniref:RodZ domain-containing protein n=1 Tax=Actinobacillus pleuropneumoniae TaxID=715 RepID=UPI003B97F083